MKDMKRIRGHHLFCMALFSGHGYDQAFADNMQELIGGFRSGEKFMLCCGEHDAVCAACPNREPSGGCALGTENVKDRDSSALEVLGLRSGDELDWHRAMARLSSIAEADFSQVCGNCRWEQEGLCSWGMLHDRATAAKS